MTEYKLVYVGNLWTQGGRTVVTDNIDDYAQVNRFYNYMVFSSEKEPDYFYNQLSNDAISRDELNDIKNKTSNTSFNETNIRKAYESLENLYKRLDSSCIVVLSDETRNEASSSNLSIINQEYANILNNSFGLVTSFNKKYPSVLNLKSENNFYELFIPGIGNALLEQSFEFFSKESKEKITDGENVNLLYNQMLIPNAFLEKPFVYYRKITSFSFDSSTNQLQALTKDYINPKIYYDELRRRIQTGLTVSTIKNYFEVEGIDKDNQYFIENTSSLYSDKNFDFNQVNYKNVFFYNVWSNTQLKLKPVTDTDKQKENSNSKTLDSGLYYLTAEDLKSLSDLPNYINQNKYFEWTHKEYVSNVFYKTLVLEIDNEFEETSKEEQSRIEKGVATTIYDIGANAFVSTAAGINNIVAQIPILSQEYPTNQFLSSSEPTYQFNFISKNLAQETAGLPLIPKAIETLRALTNKYGREYKFIPDAPFILIDSFVTRLFGSFKEEYINHIPLGDENYKVDIKKPIAIESTEHRTLESSPGATAYTLRFSESNTYDPESLKEALTNKANTEANEDFMKKALDLILSNCDLANISKDYAFKKNAFESNPGDYLSFTSKYFTADDFLRGVRLKKPELIQKLTELDLIKIVDHNLKIMAKHLDNLWDYLLSFEDIKKNESSPLLIKSFSGIKIKSGLDFSDSETRDTFSQHYFGSAVDIIVPGYNVFFIAELIRKYMHKQSKGYGLGLYGNVFIPGELSLKDMGDGAAANSGFIHFDLNLTLTSSSYSDAFTQYCGSIDKTEQEVRAITRKNKSELSSEEKVIVSAVRDLKLNNKITDTKDFASLDYSSSPRFWSADTGGEYAIKDPVTNDGIDIWKYKPGSIEETFYKVVIKNISVYNKAANFSLNKDLQQVNIEGYLQSVDSTNIQIQENDDENQERSEESVRFKTEIVDYKVKLEPESARLDKDFNPNYSGGNILTYNSWKERLEQVLGEKSSDLVGTSISDKRLKDLEDAQKKAFLTNYKNRSLSNETEVSVFTNTVGNIINADPGYFKGITDNKQLKDALDDYFNANGLVVYYDKSALPSEGNTTLNNDLSLSFYIADPSSVGSFSETASSNYNNREIINLIKMACNLKDLASIFLIEPEIYLENKEDVQKEYEMIQKELYGISPIPSFFNNLTFGVCGSLLPTAEDIIQAEAVFSNLKTDYNYTTSTTGLYLFYNFINKNHPNYNKSIISTFLLSGSEAFILAIKSTAAIVIAGIATYFGAILIAIGGLIMAVLGLSDGTILLANTSSIKEPDSISKPELNTNLFRLLENLSRGSFMTSLNTTDDVAFGTSVFAGLDRRDLFNRIYVERETKQEAIYSLNQLMIDLEDSDNHETLVNSVIRQFVEQNPVMVDYQELASTISVNNALKSLINFEFLNSNTGEKEKNIFVGKDIFDPFLAKDWIMFLVSFRHTTQFFGQLDDEDFNDCYTYDNDKKAFIQVKDSSLYIPQLDSSNENYLIERNLGSKNTVLDETTLIAKVPRVYRYSDETKRKNYFQRLKEQNKIRIAYLKNLLVQIVESLKQYDFFANNLAGFGSENQIEFDFATENAYPDIDLPLDPANPLSNINISPGFFYVKNYYSEQVLKETKSQAINILQKSYNFMGKLETGVYSGDANDFKNQAQDSITKGVIVDIKDANLTAGTGEFNNQIAVLTNEGLTELIPKIKFDSQTSNTDLDYTDISLITIQDLLKPENNTDTTYQALEEHMNSVAERASALENSFGSRAGFINETSFETLNFYKDFDDRNNTSDETNKLLGLSNDSNISLNVLQEIADVSGNKLLENQFDISKAYPTFKFYLIEEDSIDSDNIFVFDDFYSFNAIKDFTVYKSRKLAADTAVIRLQNISGTLDGTKFAVIRDVDYEINDRIIEKEQLGQVPSSEPIQSVVLRPGVCCQLRAGYSSNPRDLTILLSGRIADVAWSNNGDMCEVTVQSFAVELETRKYGASDIDNGLDEKQFHSTHKLLAWCLFRNELKHFGRYKKQRLFQKGESKDVVITKETHIGAGDPSASASMFEFFMSNWGYFVAAEIALCFVNFGALAGAGKELAKTAAKEVAEEVAESTIAAAGSDIAEIAAKEAVKDTTKVSTSAVLNIFSRNVFKAFGFGKEVIQNTPNWLGLGKLIKFVSGSGLNINASTKLINAELQIIDDAITKGLQRAGIAESPEKALLAVADDILRVTSVISTEIADQAAKTTRLSNTLAYLGNFIGWQTQTITKGSTLASRLWSINPTSLNIALEQYVAKGLTEGLQDQTLRIAVRNAILTEMTNATTNLWTTGLRKAFQAVSLGAIRAAKLGVILPLLTYSVGLVWDTVSSVLKYFYNLVMGTFNPYSEALVLSPQDDALYAPHPDRYIVGSSNFAAVQSDEAIKRLKRALAIGYLFYDPAKSNSPNEDILLNRTLLMDKRLNAKRGENVFKIKNSTIWEIFHEMSLRHPGWVYGARQYGQSLEYRMFFGLPNQRYFGKPLANLEIKRLNSIIEATTKGDEANIINLVSKETAAKVDSLLTDTTKGKRVSIMKTLLLEEWTRITKDRFIPFRSYHLISSKYNLVANNIAGSNNDVINEIAILYLENNSGSMPQYTQRVIRAHDNMTEDQVHAKAVKYDNCKGFNSALRYGTAELINAAKEMYRGEIIILGNPQINPYDICILEDEYSEMFGPIEVEAVTHIFSMDTGFITEIKPNALVTANEGLTYPVLNSVAMYDIGRELSKKADFNFRSLQDEQKKTIVSSIVDKWLDDNVNFMTLPWEKNPAVELGFTGTVKLATGGINPDFKNVLVQRTLQELEKGNIVLQSDILNPNANLGGFLTTDNIAATLASLGVAAGLARNRLGSTPAVLLGLLSLGTSQAPTLLENQLSTPGSFLVNKLLTGDMLISQVTDGNLIQVYPLFKNNRPLVYGGYQRIPLNKSIKNKLGNIFFEISEAMTMFNTISKEYSNRENIIYNKPNFVIETAGSIAESLLPFKLPAGTVTGYLGSYTKDEVINAASTGGRL